jgi:hypothetical protein
MIFFSMVDEAGIISKLFEQSFLIVTLGVVIYWLQKRYSAKDAQLEKLANGFIEVSTKWHDWIQSGHNSNKAEAERILEKLEEIKEIVENKK